MYRLRWRVEGSCDCILGLFIEEVEGFAEFVVDNFLDSVVACSYQPLHLVSTTSLLTSAQIPNYSHYYPVVC